MPVIDASVWVSLLHSKDIHHVRAARLFKRIAMDSRPILMPVTALAEVAGTISRLTQKPELARMALKQIRELDADIREIDRPFADLAAAAAVRLQLRGMDAFYVALAIEEADTLATFDEEPLERASKEIEIETF